MTSHKKDGAALLAPGTPNLERNREKRCEEEVGNQLGGGYLASVEIHIFLGVQISHSPGSDN